MYLNVIACVQLIRGESMINKLKKNAKVWIILFGALAGVVLLLIGSGDREESVKIDAVFSPIGSLKFLFCTLYDPICCTKYGSAGDNVAI